MPGGSGENVFTTFIKLTEEVVVEPVIECYHPDLGENHSQILILLGRDNDSVQVESSTL